MPIRIEGLFLKEAGYTFLSSNCGILRHGSPLVSVWSIAGVDVDSTEVKHEYTALHHAILNPHHGRSKVRKRFAELGADLHRVACDAETLPGMQAPTSLKIQR